MASIDDKLSHEEQSAFLKFVKNYEETKGYYDRNAANYDNFYKMSIGVFPIVGTRELIKHLTDVTLLKDVKIADIGAGTGAVGQLLKENGYTNLTAIDISAGMLEEAKRKNIYKEHIECDLNIEKMDKYFQQFDHAISIGCFGFGLMKPHALEKIASLVKPGSLACISFSEATLASEELGYKQKLEEMEERGVWKEISRVLDEYINNLPSQGGDVPEAVRAYYIIFKVTN